MTFKTLISAMALACLTPALSHEADLEAPEPPQPSRYVGYYNGNSFETAMGMIVRPDGTFEWGLSAGGLDMRASGTWAEVDGAIVLTSDPRPVPPEFVWSHIEERPDSHLDRRLDVPLLRLQWADSGKPFAFADVHALCANGELLAMPVMDGEWSPDASCDTVERIELYLRSYQVFSGPFKLTGKRAIEEGQTIVFDFHRNDLGLADFTGMTGRLVDGEMRLESPLGNMTLRKMPPQEPVP